MTNLSVPQSEPQRTLKDAVTVEGVGLHTGEPVKLQIKPADAGEGYTFVRVDLPGAPEIPADVYHVSNTERRTVIRQGDAEVNTIEHLLSALKGLGVDNARLEINGPECPGVDGSATMFAEAIANAGTIEQDEARRVYVLQETVSVSEGDAVVVAVPPEENEFEISYTLDYPLQALRGHIRYTLNPATYLKEIGGARTFCMEREAQALRQAGFGKGANTTNTLVYRDDGSIIDNTLRYQNEPVRHKVLDLIGDFALLGVDLRARIMATRSGHHVNFKLVKRIVDLLEEEEALGVMQRPGAQDIKEILNTLPHRYPFVMIDRILELEPGVRGVGLKNVTYNEEFFQGHFPGQPVMPGVLQLEGMAQLGGIVLCGHLNKKNKLAFLISLDRVRFRKTVVPGDQLRIEAEVVKSSLHTGAVKARAMVRGATVCEAQIRYMIVNAENTTQREPLEPE